MANTIGSSPFSTEGIYIWSQTFTTTHNADASVSSFK